MTNDLSNKFTLSNSQFVDNTYGISLQVGNGASVEAEVTMENVHIWGEDTGIISTSCVNRIGFMFSPGLMGAKPLHPLSESSLPIYKISTDAAWETKNTYGITFHDFETTALGCGSGMT